LLLSSWFLVATFLLSLFFLFTQKEKKLNLCFRFHFKNIKEHLRQSLIMSSIIHSYLKLEHSNRILKMLTQHVSFINSIFSFFIRFCTK
jgi:hypothetical protein